MWGSLLESSRSEDLDGDGRVVTGCTLEELILGICPRVNRMTVVSKHFEILGVIMKSDKFARK
jgi:hypothetical protein